MALMMYAPVDANSADINGQLLPVANGSAIFPAGAFQPNIGQGAAPSNLPGAGDWWGGATDGTVAPPAPASSAPSAGAFVGDVWKLPFWQNPLVLVLLLLVVSYTALRFVHWRP